MQKIIESHSPSVGLVIGTFAAVPYIHLQLESWKRNYPQIPLLLHDDGSPHGNTLYDLCSQYGADFTASPLRHPHFVGDLAAFVAGFRWAQERNFDLLVKFSRRFIPIYNWVRELQDLAYITQYATYSSRCIAYGFGFRTECLGVHVKSWIDNGAVDNISNRVGRNEGCFVEKYIHDLGRDVHQHSCEHNRAYERFAERPNQIAAYGDWLIMGISRHIPRPNVLWHNYTSPDIYAQQAREYGLTQYTVTDFLDPNEGLGVGEA